jgi:hypothetical protein
VLGDAYHWRTLLRRHSSPQPRSSANESPAERKPANLPLYCPLCQSPRIRRVAEMAATLVCFCEECSAEFVITPQREEPPVS